MSTDFQAQELAQQAWTEVLSQRFAWASAEKCDEVIEIYLTSRLTLVTMSTRKSFSLMPHDSIVSPSGNIFPDKMMGAL